MKYDNITLEIFRLAKVKFPQIENTFSENIKIYGNESINSIDVVEFIVLIEEHFGIELDIFNIDMNDFSTIKSISNILNSYLI